MNKNNHEFDLTPMQDYTPPTYPTRGTNPPAALKKLPMRWAKNAAIIACLGALSLGALTGGMAEGMPPASYNDSTPGVTAAYLQDSNPYTESGRTFDIEVRTHHGGDGGGPIYVAHLTEQEALGIIRNRLYQAGISFDAPVPDYVATIKTPWETEITATLSLFDEPTRQGIVFPIPWEWRPIESALQQDFKQRFDVSATFMRNPGESIARSTLTQEEKQEAGGVLKERLVSQVDAFIEQLHTDGILPLFPFFDVSQQHWARQAIAHVWEQGLMTGTAQGTFAPEETLLRAQAATILWRMAGEPAVEFQPAFNDVPITAPAWYRNAVIWANENGVVQGYAGRFDPYGEITREQLVAVLHRYAQLIGGDVSVSESFCLDNFDDRTQLSEWATDYMRWAVYHGLITGTAERTLSPLGTATRAEAAMLLMRFIEA